jgi:dipeptidase D
MSSLLSLQPLEIWGHFNEILKVPRPSKKEGKIIAWLENFAKQHKLSLKKDESGNILISKPAAVGCESKKTLVFQCHVDMVCEKNADTVHNFETDPIEAYVDGEWVTAKGTTLGADDGMGIAACLAVLSDKTLKHGYVECLFTVDEETGLTGAFNLKSGFFTGKTLINLDSEDSEEILIGCAGGIGTTATFAVQQEVNNQYNQGIIITVKGLKGGHSGDDINKGRANANKVLVRLLYEALEKVDFRISSIDGGNLHNAIAREAFAKINVDKNNVDNFELAVKATVLHIKEEFAVTEPGLTIEIKQQESDNNVYTSDFQNRLLLSLIVCPHGVQAMSRAIEGLVETSTNLASIKMKNNSIVVTTSQRSSYEPSKYDVACKVAASFTMADTSVESSDGYPGWSPNPNSALLQTAVSAYERLFNEKPSVKAIHAGLECGLFLEKYPELDMISIGPTMQGVHSPDERVHIASVEKFWKFLRAIIESN